MQVLYKGKPAEVWQISATGDQPDWVQRAFAEKYIVWQNGHLRVLMSGLNPSAASTFKTGAAGTMVSALGGGIVGGNMYVLGYLGDFLDVTNRRIVSAKKFAKQYTETY